MSNIAVVGSGYWGKNLVRNFHELGALHTICDSSFTTLRGFQDRYPGKNCQVSYDAVIQDPAVHAVVLSTPAETHHAMAKKALLAGKHVYVEKPLALTLADAHELNQLAEETGLTLMVGHILLYHPAILALKSIIDSGELGRISYIYSNRLNLGKFRCEENILWSFAPHDISAMLYLLGEMPESVAAQGGNYLNREIADVTMSVLSFKSGVKGHIFVSWLHPHKEQKLVVVGDKKMAVFDDTLDTGKLRIHDKGVDWVNRQPVPRKNKARIVPLQALEPLKEECAHFLECIASQKRPRSDSWNGIEVLTVLQACQESLQAGGPPVKVTGNALQPSFFVHESAVIDPPCVIGQSTKIWHFSHIMQGCEIGDGCNIGQNVVVSPGTRIGNNVKIQNNVSIYTGVTLEDDVFCGPSMVFTNVFNPRSHVSRKHEYRKTLVKRGATIGANATVVCGNTIGRYAMVAAGAVVTKDVPDHALVMGNPARVSGWVCQCGVKLDFKQDSATCRECGRAYAKSLDTVRPFEAEMLREERDIPFVLGAAIQQGMLSKVETIGYTTRHA